jgi:hypothetical protein
MVERRTCHSEAIAQRTRICRVCCGAFAKSAFCFTRHSIECPDDLLCEDGRLQWQSSADCRRC